MQDETNRHAETTTTRATPQLLLEIILDEDIRTLILAELIDCVAEVGSYAPERRHGESCATRFAHYLGSLESLEAEYAAHLLVTSAIGQLEATRWYTRPSLDVLLELSRSHQAALLVSARARIERLFDDPDALMRWLRPKRERSISRGRAFVGTWSYAIGLWEVLQALHSPHSSRVLTQILQLHRVWRQVSQYEESMRRRRRNKKSNHVQPVCVPRNWMRRSLAW